MLRALRKARYRSRAAPVYIYPGVIRMSAQRALAVDTACPALKLSTQCAHTCSICLERMVQERDIVRELPCTHVFHSRCM